MHTLTHMHARVLTCHPRSHTLTHAHTYAQLEPPKVLLKEGHAFNAHNRPVPCGSQSQQEAIRRAKTSVAMYEVRHPHPGWALGCGGLGFGVLWALRMFGSASGLGFGISSRRSASGLRVWGSAGPSLIVVSRVWVIGFRVLQSAGALHHGWAAGLGVLHLLHTWVGFGVWVLGFGA